MMDLVEIQKLLPHRYPFLLIDRVVEIIPGQKLLGYKNVTINEPFFESLAQAGAILAYKSADLDPTREVSYLMAIDGAKFRKPVVPGDRLDLEVSVLKHKGAVWKQKGTASVNGVKVAEGEFLATVVGLSAKPPASEP
jgi:3-hydroxyacyl-[acyl-carrier-protein] dehydratase